MLKSKPAYEGSHDMMEHHNCRQKLWDERGHKEVPSLVAQRNVRHYNKQ